ncbi:MAG TPA: NADH-quinone oxidoreductase subunit M [Gemmataceae bacterium]|nr:NADH-quinone oxidoreductase subunit M [Gemmataceae bacterium]
MELLSPDLIRTLLPALLGLPVAAALVLRMVRDSAAGATATWFAVGHLVLTLVVLAGSLLSIQSDPELSANINRGKGKEQDERVFAPQFVPGDPLPNAKPSYQTTWEVLPLGGDGPKVQGAQFFIGLDGLNVWLVLLTSLMTVPVVLVSRDTIREREGAFYSWLFLLQAATLGVFLSFDLLLFYVCFELTLVPLLFLIGGWGPGPNRREAARKLFLFTLAGGLITLVGVAGTVLFVYDRTGELTFSIPRLADLVQTNLKRSSGTGREIWLQTQTYLFLALAAGFAVKVPIVPLHSWLPGAYAEAPTGVTVMLSALLAKMGAFGLVRICLPLCPDATLAVGMPLVGTLAVVGIVYGAFCAYAQTDLRRLVAYSSVSHLGFCVLALMAASSIALSGGVLHMFNHGLSTGAMFLMVGMLTRRYGSAQIADYSGLWTRLPVFTFFLMVFCLSSVGLPGLNNFVSEVMMLLGVFDARSPYVSGPAYAAVAVLGVFLSAWYTMTMIRRALFGPVKEPPTAEPVTDLTGREKAALVPLAVLCLALGLLPQTVLQVMERDMVRLAQVADEARARTR